MMIRVLRQVSYAFHGEDIGPEALTSFRVDCHHNYIEEIEHEGKKSLLTRKGAVSAKAGEYGIIPGSMGTKSYIVRGKGNSDSFCSCSHGAGRRMSRGAAKKKFTVADLESQTNGVDCRKDEGVLDEIPGAYKDIDQVMANQTDLVDIEATLKQIICVKG
jgi:tRNA-splicing ligase RtcB